MAGPLDRTVGAVTTGEDVSGGRRRLPPGQYIPRGWPVTHYGPVPRFDPARWDFRVYGATDADVRWGWPEFGRLPRTEVVADFHCVTKFSMLGNRWGGVSTAVVLDAAPPSRAATHVMVWAEYGYAANMTLADFAAPECILASRRGDEPLSAEHGWPVRLVVPHLYGWKGPKWVRGIEYLAEDRRGFWEERGYHNHADPWREERYSYQE